MEKISTPKTERELRTEQAEKIIKFLDRTNTFVYVKELLKTDAMAEKPDFKQFKDFLVRLNGIARDISGHERSTDGKEVHLTGFIENVVVPRHEDKESLLQYAYEQSQSIDKEYLQYLLPSVINAVHLFSDGNGRTSRIIHLLLKVFSSKDEFNAELETALGEFGRFDSFDINPGLINHELNQAVLKKHGWVYSEENPQGALGQMRTGIASVEIRKLEKENPSYESARKLLDLASNNDHYVLTAIYMEIGDGIQDLMSEYGNEKISLISPKRMLEILRPEQWRGMIDKFYQLKKEEVETLVDVFVSPEKYPGQNGGEQTLRDSFINKVKKKTS